MKKIFSLIIAALAIISCERNGTIDETNTTIKNEKISNTKASATNDSLHVNAQFEQEVDPGTIVPPRR